MTRRASFALLLAALCSCGDDGSSAGMDSPGGSDGSTVDVPAGTKRVFITNATFGGALSGGGGLAGGDTACTTASASGGLGGTWKAWLSTTTVNAIDRVTGNGPWVDTKGTVIFANRTSLSSMPATSLWYSESGLFLSSDRIWTGTGFGGTYVAALGGTAPCAEWTSSAMSNQAKVGQVGRSDSSWTAQSNTTCDQLSHLICFEQ